MLEFIVQNWVVLVLGLIAFAWVIVRLTPTQTDDFILTWIENIINAVIPDRKSGGGIHPK